MIVETYEVDEATTDGRDSFEIEAEALALIEKLGLHGQQELTAGAEDDETVRTRVPYQTMTAEERAVYRIIFPAATSVESYKAGPIPLRVLQVVAHARTMFERLVIWHPQDKQPDPVLVGINGPEYGPHEIFLLARWGDALAPFDELRERARSVVTRRFTSKAKQVIAECQGFLSAPDASVEKALAGENQWGPWSQ